MSTTIESAQEFIRASGLRGWLTRDYRYTNPIFLSALGTHVENLTRPVWLYIPGDGDPVVIAHDVDAGRFPPGSPPVRSYSNRDSMIEELRAALPRSGSVAMEYSPMYELPRVGRVDAGTIELVRSLGPEVVSSGDIIQHATERWSESQLASHMTAVDALHRTVNDAFEFVGENVRWKLTEHDVAEFIRGRFDREGLVTDDGPVVAFEEHSSDPHYEPAPAARRSFAATAGSSSICGQGSTNRTPSTQTSPGPRTSEARRPLSNNTCSMSSPQPEMQVSAFSKTPSSTDRYPEGWEVDAAARQVITDAGYAEYFVHRLGHSLGREVHSNGVNLDGWETRDTRRLIQGVGVTIEPGVYLPKFGVRSEIDVYMSPDGPVATGEVQREVVVIETA